MLSTTGLIPALPEARKFSLKSGRLAGSAVAELAD
jgi:hypothetical protein